MGQLYKREEHWWFEVLQEGTRGSRRRWQEYFAGTRCNIICNGNQWKSDLRAAEKEAGSPVTSCDGRQDMA